MKEIREARELLEELINSSFRAYVLENKEQMTIAKEALELLFTEATKLCV